MLDGGLENSRRQKEKTGKYRRDRAGADLEPGDSHGSSWSSEGGALHETKLINVPEREQYDDADGGVYMWAHCKSEKDDTHRSECREAARECRAELPAVAADWHADKPARRTTGLRSPDG